MPQCFHVKGFSLFFFTVGRLFSPSEIGIIPNKDWGGAGRRGETSMSYVPQLHEITPDFVFIFWLLCYCQTKQRPQVARWTQATEGRAGRRMERGERGGAEGAGRAGTEGRGHSGQRGAKGGQRSRGLRGGISGGAPRGRWATATDAPQVPQRPRRGHPHPTRLGVTPSLANILLSCDRAVSKIISPKVN